MGLGHRYLQFLALGHRGRYVAEQLRLNMPYWNAAIDGSDFAFDAVGVIVLQTVERLEKEANLVIEKHHPEQSMLALLKVIDLLSDGFPKCVSLHFRKRQYTAIKEKYIAWRNSCAEIPQQHINEFERTANALFETLDRKLQIATLDGDERQ